MTFFHISVQLYTIFMIVYVCINFILWILKIEEKTDSFCSIEKNEVLVKLTANLTSNEQSVIFFKYFEILFWI